MLKEHPFAVVFMFLYLLGTARGQGTYWLARVVTEQALARTRPMVGWRLRLHQWLAADGVGRGRALLNKWGLVAVPVCYLTVGVQTLVLAAAGVTRVRWLHFTLAQIPGALAWATIYSTIGFAAWYAAWRAAAGERPWLTAAVVLGICVAGACLGWRARRRVRA